MDKREIVSYLKDFFSLMQIVEENSFKLKAYNNAIRKFEYMDEGEFLRYIRERKLESIKGIGKKISNNVYELFEEGQIREYEELKRSVPEGLLMMLKIPGLGPKKVKKIYEELGIQNIKDLKKAVLEGKLRELKGFGSKIDKKILDGIQFILKGEGLFRYDIVYQKATEIGEFLINFDIVEDVKFCGKLRRFENAIDEMDIILVPGKKSEDEFSMVIKDFSHSGDVLEYIKREDNLFSFLLSDGMKLNLYRVFKSDLPYCLQQLTGSARHNELLNDFLSKKNMYLSKEGLFDGSGNKIPCESEEELYFKMGFKNFIIPEIREGMGEIEAALQGKLTDIVSEGDLKGVIHLHTTYSDGRNSILEMAEYCMNRGYKYMVVSDHSKSAFYANGLSEERVFKQFEEIDRLNERLDSFRILKGIEVDILKDGSLDYDDSVLSKFDIVIASIHSSFSMSKEEMTERILRALENRYVDILGHPTGRLILQREGYKVDMDRIFEVAMRNNKAIEINANPHRLDLDWKYVKRAMELGIKLSINPDAHITGGIDDIFWGVLVARKGWAKKSMILNCLECEELLQWKKKRLLK